MTARLPLSFSRICKAYGKHEVLRGFSGDFASGRIAALVGPNGAGKTTLLRIAARLQFPDAGTVEGTEVLYYGGFDTLPVSGNINTFRDALGLAPVADGKRRLQSLSRGQLHSVGLKAALELRRHTVLLDEPWTALEPDARQDLNVQLAALAREGHVVVCSTHDLDEVARLVDDVVLLKGGTAIWRRREEEPSARFDRATIMALYRGE